MEEEATGGVAPGDIVVAKVPSPRSCLALMVSSLPGDPLNRTIQNAVPLKLKCVFPLRKKSKSRYSELSFEKSIHPLKFMDPRFQVVPPLAVSQVTALYNPSLNNIHHDK